MSARAARLLYARTSCFPRPTDGGGGAEENKSGGAFFAFPTLWVAGASGNAGPASGVALAIARDARHEETGRSGGGRRCGFTCVTNLTSHF